MSKEKRPHLGRGLASLLGPISSTSNTPSKDNSLEKELSLPPKTVEEPPANSIDINIIKPNPYQPRKHWSDDDLLDLSRSIEANGIIQPIIVRKAKTGYEIIAGERRFRAANIVGLKTVPVVIREANDEQMLELALVENIHRADLNPIERAQAYQNYINTFSITQSDAATRLGEDRSNISNHIRLLDLPEEIKQMLIDNQLSMGHARALLSLPTDDIRKKLANRAMAGRLSVREVEKQVKKALKGSRQITEVPAVQRPSHISDLEDKFKEYLATKVKIKANKKGHKGSIIIDFYSLDDFDRLANKMGIPFSDINLTADSSRDY